jgi:glycosyltransferase involved in cell wall biosynthesis
MRPAVPDTLQNMTGRIRVMFVIGSLEIGGAQKHVYDLLRSLPRERYDLDVVIFKRGGFYYEKVKELGISLHNLDICNKKDLVFKFAHFIRVVQRLRPDVMHLFLFYSSVYGSVAAAFCRPSPAVIFSKRSMGLQISATRRLAYRHLIMSRADVVTAVSQPVADQCIRLGVSPKLVQVVENGIEWSDHAERGRLREALGLSHAVPLVGTVGSMTARKRQHLLLQAAPLILARKPDVHFVIMGDGVLRRELVSASEALGIKEHVHLPGVLAPATRYLADLSVFVLPSSEEGTSNALLEAMMLGVPCVASDIPSNRQVIAHGETGQLVDVACPSQLADAVLRMLEDPAAAARLAAGARDRVAGHYRLNESVATNASLYDTLALRRNGATAAPMGGSGTWR